MKNVVICISGMAGAGKSVVSDFFIEKGYKYVRFGQITLDEVVKRGLTLNEANERIIREEIRKKHGMAAFGILNFPKLKKLLKSANVIADGLYSWSEYKFLKEKFGRKMVVIGVFAPPHLRYARISKRKLSKKDKNLRNRSFTVQEAKSRDFAEIENLEKGGPIAMADYTILNTKDLAFLKSQLNEIYKEIV